MQARGLTTSGTGRAPATLPHNIGAIASWRSLNGPSYIRDSRRPDRSRTIAAVMNSAANFWKHRNEWPLESNPTRREHTLEAFDALGVPESESSLTGILAALVPVTPPRLTSLLPLLEAWRDAATGGAL